MSGAVQTKECFIICPIGDEDSDTRKRADKVLKHILTPALEASGYSAIRADEIAYPGVITSQIIDHLLHAPLVIADLTDQNPNVFYELAIRHAAKKPIIQIIQRGQVIPFDVALVNTIEYDWDVVHADRSKSAIIKQIKYINASSDIPTTPLTVAIEHIQIKARARSSLVVATDKHYKLATELVKSAKNQIVLCQRTSTILLGAERGRIPEEAFSDALRDKLNNGIPIFHLIHEESCMADVWRMPGKFDENLGNLPKLDHCYIGRYNGDKPIPRLLIIDSEVMGCVFDIDQTQYYEVIDVPEVELVSQNAIRYITDRALEEFQLNDFLEKLKQVREKAGRFYRIADTTSGDAFAEYFADYLRKNKAKNIFTEYPVANDGKALEVPLAAPDKKIGIFFDSITIADEARQRQQIWTDMNRATSEGWQCFFFTRSDLLTRLDELTAWVNKIMQ